MKTFAARYFVPIAALAVIGVVLHAAGLTTMTVGHLIAYVGIAMLALIIAWHRKLSTAITPRGDVTPLRRRYPSITVVRPVRGKDVGAAENFKAALDTGYPGEVETLFVFDDDKDPGLPVARQVVAQHRRSGRRGTADVIIAGTPPKGRTGKLNAMVVGRRMAHGELIAFGDSDTRPDHDVLRVLVETLLASPENGSAFAPVLVDKPAQAGGDVFYALMQNALYSPLAAYKSGERRELPFIMGQLMVFRREALEAIGGVERADGQLVDDMAIGRFVHEAGYRNVMTRHPLHIATGGMTLREFVPVYKRWMSFSRNGLPFSFVWRQWAQGAEFFVALIAFVAGVATGNLIAALAPLAALVAHTVSMLTLQRRYGGAPTPLRFAWAPFLLIAISPYIMLANALKKRVVWRGREYAVDGSAALVAAASTPIKLAPAARRPLAASA